MEDPVVRMRIPRILMKRFKVICVGKDLTVPKQTAELIRKFVELHEENDKRLAHTKDVK